VSLRKRCSASREGECGTGETALVSLTTRDELVDVVQELRREEVKERGDDEEAVGTPELDCQQWVVYACQSQPRTHLTSTSPPWQTTKPPSGRLHLMKNSYVFCLASASCSQPPLGPEFPMIANEQVEAYVGSKWGSWELAGPPAKPPSGESICKSVDTALR
jgi:hypothetical protein